MFKFCKSSALIGWKGQAINLRAGSVWSSDDPFVRAHPEMFSDVPEALESSTGVTYRGVEQATAAPGEKRAR